MVDLISQGDALLASADAVTKGGKLISTLMGPDQAKFPQGVSVTYIQFSPTPGDLDELVRSTANGSLQPNVTERFSFADVPQAYAALRDGHVRGKIVVSNLLN